MSQKQRRNSTNRTDLSVSVLLPDASFWDSTSLYNTIITRKASEHHVSPQVYLEGKFGEKPGVDFIQRTEDAVKTGWPQVVEPVIRGIVWLLRDLLRGPLMCFQSV